MYLKTPLNCFQIFNYQFKGVFNLVAGNVFKGELLYDQLIFFHLS